MGEEVFFIFLTGLAIRFGAALFRALRLGRAFLVLRLTLFFFMIYVIMSQPVGLLSLREIIDL